MSDSTEKTQPNYSLNQKVISFSKPVGERFEKLKDRKKKLRTDKVYWDTILTDLMDIAEKKGYPEKNV